MVDLENVYIHWSHILPRITPDDKVTIFYTRHVPILPLAFLRKVLDTGAKLELIECHPGTNALDFQLVSELGARIQINPDVTFAIISGDTGYDSVIHYWRDRKIITMRLAPNIPSSNTVIPHATGVKPADNQKVTNVKPDGNSTTIGEHLKRNYEEAQAKKSTPTSISPFLGKNTIPVYEKLVEIADEQNNMDCLTIYIRKMRDTGIPNQHIPDIAEIIVNAMRQPTNRRRITVYNALLSMFGRKSGSEYYKKIEYALSEILTIGPFPAT